MKSCESCIFATATHGRFKTTLADGTTLTQNGGVNYICHHPGGVKSLSFNRDTGAMTCSEYVEKEAVCGDE